MSELAQQVRVTRRNCSHKKNMVDEQCFVYGVSGQQAFHQNLGKALKYWLRTQKRKLLEIERALYGKDG